MGTLTLTERLEFPETALARLPLGQPADHLLRTSVRNDTLVVLLPFPTEATFGDTAQLIVDGNIVGEQVSADDYIDAKIPLELLASERLVEGEHAINYQLVLHSGQGQISIGPSDQRFIVDYTSPGAPVDPQAPSIGSPGFDPGVIEDAVTLAQLTTDADGHTYLPATVIPYHGQAIGDVLLGYIDGVVATDGREVLAGEVGKIIEVGYTLAALEVVDGGRHAFHVEVVDRAENPPGFSDPVELMIRLRKPRLKIVGSRSKSAPFYHVNASRIVAEVDAVGANIEWKYAGASALQTSPFFTDIHPALALEVTIREDDDILAQAILRPGNVTGIYNTDARWSSGCIVKNDGTLYGWGSTDMRPPVEASEVVHVAVTRSAYAAISIQGGVLAWGDPLGGGLIPDDVHAILQDVVAIAATGAAFVAILTKGTVVAWGDPLRGGSIPPTIATYLHDVVDIVGTDDAFAARTLGGDVIAWGAPWPYGMHVKGAAGSAALAATDHAFASLSADGKVFTWGDPDEGGRIPDDLAPRLTGVIQVVASSRAFAALRSDGDVLAWGDPRFGGQMPFPVTQAEYLAGSTTAFVAVDRDGLPSAWGDPDEGGTPPSDQVMKVVVGGYGSFAAILADGSAMSWGRTHGRYDQSDAVAVYSAGPDFVVLTEQNRLVSWGVSSLDLSILDSQVGHTTSA